MRRSNRRKKRASGAQEEVELNMAAMLDMAFQLLAFFILTFKPSEIEAQISMRMPKERAVTQGAQIEIETPPETIEPESDSLPLDVRVLADTEGGIDHVMIAGNEFRDAASQEFFPSIKQKVAGIVGLPGCDEVRVYVSESLKYEYLMQVVDICAQQTTATGERMTKISISTIK